MARVAEVVRMTRERRQWSRFAHLCEGPRSEAESRAFKVGCSGGVLSRRWPAGYAENELPQPQPPVAVGFLNVKPEPCIDVT